MVVLVPGITVSTVVSTALARGVAGGLWLEAGATLARFSMVLIVAVALEAVTGFVSAVFDIIKYAGAAYLAWMGFGYLTSRSSITISEGAPVTAWRQVLTGFLVLWGNPKALLFFGAFLPQFVNPAWPAWPQVVLLGLIEMGAAILVDGGLHRGGGHRPAGAVRCGGGVDQPGGRGDPDRRRPSGWRCSIADAAGLRSRAVA